ncbi:MAG: LytR C-terminal domain-containing protein [Gemmatimonadales bacterium]
MNARARWLLAGGAIGVLLLAPWVLRRPDPAGDTARAEWPPLPRRVEVEVLNGGTVDLAARIVTAHLRRGGLDVVLYDNAPPEWRDSLRIDPLVLVRRGDTTGVGRIRDVLGPIEVRDVPDPKPLVDLTVVVGARVERGEPEGIP